MVLIATQRKWKDEPKDWTRFFVPPPDFPVDLYQQRINEIAGVYEKRPVLRLEWGGNTTVTKVVEWDGFGTPIKEHKVPKHAVPRQAILFDENTIEYIPIRRWVITQWQTPEQLRADQSETFTNERGVNCKTGEKPREGDYTPLIYIGDHSLCPVDCCEKKLCFGDYKHPGAEELDWILETTYKLQSERITNPFKEEFSDAEQSAIDLEVKNREEAKRQSADSLFDEEAKDWWKCHGHRIYDEDPSVLSHGKYKFYKDGKPV